MTTLSWTPSGDCKMAKAPAGSMRRPALSRTKISRWDLFRFRSPPPLTFKSNMLLIIPYIRFPYP